MKSKPFAIPHLLEGHFIGKDLEQGPLPALFYFSLSATESLEMEPYNSPARLFASPETRVFSFTLPGHGDGFDKHHAMHYWAQELSSGHPTLQQFIENARKSIAYLIDQGIVIAEKSALSGLSRGAFIATHIAALEKRVPSLLCFAPLTSLAFSASFKPFYNDAWRQWDLISLVDQLTHLKHVRFYIGALDTMVSTDACYAFIQEFNRVIHEKRARSCHVELVITPSIGHQGHGTAPHTFEEGIEWLKKWTQ